MTSLTWLLGRQGVWRKQFDSKMANIELRPVEKVCMGRGYPSVVFLGIILNNFTLRSRSEVMCLLSIREID